MSKRKIGLISAGALLAAGLTFAAGAPPALASTADCSYPNMCYWNGGGFPGTPHTQVVGAPYHNQYVNVPDNIISSGISKRPYNGVDRWCGLNQLNVAFSETVARFNYNVGVNLVGAYGDNKIDDLLYSNC